MLSSGKTSSTCFAHLLGRHELVGDQSHPAWQPQSHASAGRCCRAIQGPEKHTPKVVAVPSGMESAATANVWRVVLLLSLSCEGT